jgi:competence protein ComEC
MPNLDKERHNFWLWLPILFAFGCIFFISFQQNFLDKIILFSALFCAAAFLAFLNRTSNRLFIYLAVTIFLLGNFYTFFYQKTFLNYTEITGKVYVDGVGKVESIKKFHNKINHLDGLHIVISEPILQKSKFSKKKKVKKKKRKRKTKINSRSLNLKDYQHFDRKFTDYSKGYQRVDWVGEKSLFPNAPPKIAINMARANDEIAVNDKIAFKALLLPQKKRDFKNDFNYAISAKAKKIGASGFAIGSIEILEKQQISNFSEYFLHLREKIRGKIKLHLSGDYEAIAGALLIGDQKAVSKETYQKIRISGLAHLLSISGFHLSLAGAIFFISSRLLLACSERLALNFDIKKIAAVLALIATYFYLKIAGSPIPAQRAFLMILLVFLALIFHEKTNAKRAVMASMLALTLYNPYVTLNIGFQLSFVAVLVLSVFFAEFKYEIPPKFLKYFYEIILISILIQTISLPFILHSFSNVAWLGFLANILAIPLTSFLIMPLGFLAIFLMPFGLEKYALLAMNEGIILLEKIINFINNIPGSDLSSPYLSSIGLIIATVGIALMLFHKKHLRCYGMILFLLSFSELKISEKPDLIFEKEQKFFAIYDKENGLVFSKKIRDSKQRRAWMKRFNENEFKVVDFCEKNKCEFEKKGKKILIILKRSKISEICKNEFDLVVNLTKKHELPSCVKSKQLIDNFDFYSKGTHEINL